MPACAVLALLLAGCRRDTLESTRTERALLDHRIESLERLVRTRPAGHVIPFDQGLIVLRQELLEDLLRATLPLERSVGGRFRVRILTAQVACEDGAAFVRLDGRASFADRPEAEGYADATVYGALHQFAVMPEKGALRGRIEVIGFEVHRVKIDGEEKESVRELLRDFARLQIEAFNGIDYAFDIPVNVVHNMTLPSFDSDHVRVPPSKVPLHVSVTAVTALRGRLWISLQLRPRAGGHPDRGGTIDAGRPT